MKRFSNAKNLLINCGVKAVVTSNIKNPGDGFWVVNYANYLNEENSIIDNAGIMSINLLKKSEQKIFYWRDLMDFQKI